MNTLGRPTQEYLEQPRYSDRQFLHTTSAGVKLPLAQAGAASLATMILTAAIIYAFDGMDYFKPIIIVGALTFAATLIGMMTRWITLTRLEKTLRLDLNKDGHIGDVKERLPRMRIQIDEITNQGHIRSRTMGDLPATPELLQEIAIGVIDQGRSLAETEWSPLKAGKPCSIGQIRKIKDWMRAQTLIAQKPGSTGDELTGQGRAVFEKWKTGDFTVSDGDLTSPSDD